MPKKIITWVLVADGAHARILTNEGPGHGLRPAPDGEFEAASLHTRDIVSDRQGRRSDTMTGGGSRHAMDPKTDPHNHVEKEFARHLARFLENQAVKKSFERLVVAAPPRMLGDLRAELSKHARAAVTAEIDKDLVRLSDNEIAGHLGDIVL